MFSIMIVNVGIKNSYKSLYFVIEKHIGKILLAKIYVAVKCNFYFTHIILMELQLPLSCILEYTCKIIIYEYIYIYVQGDFLTLLTPFFGR